VPLPLKYIYGNKKKIKEQQPQQRSPTVSAYLLLPWCCPINSLYSDSRGLLCSLSPTFATTIVTPGGHLFPGKQFTRGGGCNAKGE